MVKMTGCTVLVAARCGSRPPMLSHSFDTPGGVDFRLVRVPANPNPPSPRPVFGWDENCVPRFSGGLRGPIPAYDVPSVPASEPIGHIPQVAAGGTFGYWEAASGIANERGVMMGESTCSSIFGAKRVGAGGQALLQYQELTRIALERCATARAAVELVGALAEEHGFAGNDDGLGGSAESLAVIDGDEAWVMHIMPDESGASAIWAAQRVPDGEAACVANMFVIRTVPLDDPARFLCSDSMTATAGRLGLWAEGEPFDFAAMFSAGEARHKYYSGRRQWRALSLLAPSVASSLSPEYGDLLTETGYPFSVRMDKKHEIDPRALMEIMRDTYKGTPYDLARQPAAGPWGATDRYDAGNGAKATPTPEDGAWERPIGVYRMAYSYVCEARKAGDGGRGGPARAGFVHFAPHCSQTSVYMPVHCVENGVLDPSPGGRSNALTVPYPLGAGSVTQIDREVCYWAFRCVKHTACGLPWQRCLEMIRERQTTWEDSAMSIVYAIERGGKVCTPIDGAGMCDALVWAVVTDWAKLNDDLLLRFGDGYEHGTHLSEDGSTFASKPLVYPQGWLERVGFYRGGGGGGGGGTTQEPPSPGPPPDTVLWTLEKKVAHRTALLQQEETALLLQFNALAGPRDDK